MQILLSLIVGIRARSVLELGAFEGTSTVPLAMAAALNGGRVVAVELDPERLATAAHRLVDNGIENADLCNVDAITFLKDKRGTFDFAFVDDDHGYAHVQEEIELLIPLMNPGGIIAMHDVLGVFGLDRIVYRNGGIILHTPLLHAAGGLGLISIHDPHLHNAAGEEIRIVA